MKAAAKNSPEQIAFDPDLHARLAGLGNLARMIFIDRNAQGMPKRDRSKIKAEARPHFRQAIKHVRKSRDALLAGDMASHECERDRARMYAAFARLEFLQPYANRRGLSYADIAARSPDGGKATAEKYARPELDDLIRGCLKRGERTRTYAKAWAADFRVSADTVERAVKRIKQELGKA